MVTIQGLNYQKMTQHEKEAIRTIIRDSIESGLDKVRQLLDENGVIIRNSEINDMENFIMNIIILKL